MIHVLRNIHSRGMKGYRAGLQLILIVAIIAVTAGGLGIMFCPSFDWCLNKLLPQATYERIVRP